MQITLPVDRVCHPIQTLAADLNTFKAIGGVSDRVALPTGSEIVRVGVSNDCYALFGDNTVAADGTSMFLPKGVEVFRVPTGATHIAFIQSSAGGMASITKMV